MLALSKVSAGQTFTETITKETQFLKQDVANTVIVANINGGITIIGYAGDKILVEAEKIITAKNETLLEEGKRKIEFGVIETSDTLIFYIKGTCSEFNTNKQFNKKGWGYQWNNCEKESCRENYNYKMNFVLKVPFTSNVYASTINDGNIRIENVKGKVNAQNVNGNITLLDLRQSAIASTINGNVDVSYTNNPGKDCYFYTLNGDINANFVRGLAIDLSFQSFNGSFFTNVDAIEPLPLRLERVNKGYGIKYKVQGNYYRVGAGGPRVDFETFNGNVYLKESQN
jgi:hypothetical protein